MKQVFTIILILFFGAAKGQTTRPDIFLSSKEMTLTGGSPNAGESTALNTSGANITKTVVFPATDTYRVDLVAYSLNQTPIVKVDVDGVSVNIIISSTNTILNHGIFSGLLPIITSGTHTLTISLTNYSSMAAIGLIYLTRSCSPNPYVYAIPTPISLVTGQIIKAKHFQSKILRGFDCEVSATATNQYFIDMRATGANLARCMLKLTPNPSDTNNYVFQSGALTAMDNHVNLAEQQGFYIMITFEVMPENTSQMYWGTTTAAITKRKNIAKVWKTVAARYNGRYGVGGYDLINEPRGYGGYNLNYAEVLRFEQQMIDSIRIVDALHVIAVEVENNNMLSKFIPLPDSNLIYSPHGYNPFNITNQGVVGTVRNKYPTITATSNQPVFGKADLSKQHDGARAMASRFNVPIWYGEFSCIGWAPLNDAGKWTSIEWVNDNISLIEAEGFSWTYHAWRNYEGWDSEIPSSWWNTLTYVNAKPTGWSYSSANPQRTSAAPTITMLKGWFALNK